MDLYILDDAIKGRGVYARRDYAIGELIEICPVLVIPETQLPHLDQTMLYDYYFLWNEKDAAIALGYGSIYNHSTTPNARYETFYEDRLIKFYAYRAIHTHQEILVNYNHDVDDMSKVWFEK